MKKIILISTFLVLLTTMPMVNAQSVTNPFNLENISIIPSKIYVGSNFTLSGTIRDISTQYLYAARLTIQGGFPFSKTSPLMSLYIGDIRFNYTYQFSVPLSIDNDATNQQYPLQMMVIYTLDNPGILAGGGTATIFTAEHVSGSQMLTATVKVDKGVDMEIVNESFSQSIVPDMKNGVVTVYVQNQGQNTAEQVQFKLAAEYPFTPTGNSYFIDSIQPGETKSVPFHIDVDSAAAAQNYPIDVNIKWKEGNNQYFDTRTIGIPVQPSNLSLPFLVVLQTNGIIIIAGVIVVGAMFVLWKIKGKPKKSTKS
jgi:hypothetical protein